MCRLAEHKCYCGLIYNCDDPNWMCPTINSDEQANMCPSCLDKTASDMQKWFDDKRGM